MYGRENMKCTDCKYCVEQDEGYSNWTVEGTEIDCLLGKNATDSAKEIL
jgi:hypothetical protein